MAIKIQELAFVLRAKDYLSPTLAKVTGQIEQLNAAVKNTAHLREAAGHLAVMGAGLVALGGVGALAIKSVVSGSAEIDESMRHLDTALDTGTAGIREHAEALKFAREMSVKFNYSQNDIIDNLYRSMSFIGDWNAAIANTSASLIVAKGNMGDAKTIGESLATFYNDFGNKTKPAEAQITHFADLIAYTARHGAFHDVNELMAGVSAGIGSAKVAGMSPEDYLATIQGFSAVGLKGSEAGTAIMEVLARFATGKLKSVLGVALATTKTGTLDVIGTLVNLRKEVGAGAITVDKFMKAAQALGVRGDRALALNVADLVKFDATLHNSDLIKGAALSGAAKMMAAFNEQMGALGKILDRLKDAFGDALLGPIQKIGAHLVPILTAAAKFAEAHPQIVKFVALFVAMGSTLAIVAGGALLAAGGLLAMASFIPVGGAVLAIGAAIGVALTATTAALAVWAPNVLRTIVHALEAVPGWIGSHWKTLLLDAVIIAFTGPLGAAIVLIKDFGPQIFAAGASLMHSLASGIASEAMAPIHAVARIAEHVKNYFVGHSPPPLGPLHQLNRVHLIETIAATMKPTPMLAAIRRVAQVTAVALPMAIGAPAMSLGAPGVARAAGARTISYAPQVTINAVGGDPAALKRAIVEALREHGHELRRILDNEDSVHNRAKF